ncbi:anthranilate synthase component II [Ferruginibacter yonginensis]|uniref:Anthranilate synthase component II n=1 Tax=Ferruginibacter yonginensis TaxID=1310416 RepID=A0ABV8QPJ2_9BACT
MLQHKILVLDNYDSFTYNLVHAVEAITGITPDVYRNDAITLAAIDAYQHIILSPGPGVPTEAGILIDVIKQYAATKKILGVCLGHQAIAEAFGGSLINLDTVFHGVATPIHQTKNTSYLFDGLPPVFDAGRYHSWIVDGASLPIDFDITATDENGYIMAMQHKVYDVQSVQFHPESILTPLGMQMLTNWVKHSTIRLK